MINNSFEATGKSRKNKKKKGGAKAPVNGDIDNESREHSEISAPSHEGDATAMKVSALFFESRSLFYKNSIMTWATLRRIRRTVHRPITPKHTWKKRTRNPTIRARNKLLVQRISRITTRRQRMQDIRETRPPSKRILGSKHLFATVIHSVRKL